MQFNSSSIDFGCFTPRTDKYRIEFVVTATYYITEHCSGTSAVTTTAADPQTTTEYFLLCVSLITNLRRHTQNSLSAIMAAPSSYCSRSYSGSSFERVREKSIQLLSADPQ